MKKLNLWKRFFPIWVVANAIGWLTYEVLIILPYWGLFAAIAIGFFISLLQWMVLNKFYDIDSMWLWISTITYGGLIIFFMRYGYLPLIPLILITIAILAILGLLQRVVLNYYINSATTWLIASPLAAAAGLFLLSVPNFLGITIPSGIVWALFGLIYGCITGATLVMLSSDFDAARLNSIPSQTQQ